MRITSAGRVAIGSSDPTNRFEVHHADERGGMSLVNTAAGNAHSEIRFAAAGAQRWGLGCDFDADGGQDFFLWDDVSDAVRLRVDDIGRVGIGNAEFGTSSLYKLYVEGGIVTRDVLVTAEDFPDFVFANDYALRSLDELREYLNEHYHLPGIPSAAEVAAKGGVEVGDLQVRMLQVVEEQALYILQLEERIARLEETIAAKK
ncbi:MAG: hypothetical protein IPL52_07400 [Flavobacteriales bacterium]|nr:hypothetical protein [Flavobacteriales bacterium]